ncbi:MAG: PD-(D/E)XK nuclease-like domain-containing protein [Planctomycetaceae bacterium]
MLAELDMPLGQSERYLCGSNDDYHAGPGLSNSMIGDYIENPAKFHAIHIAKTLPRKAPTKDTTIGTLLHELLLEGEFKSAVVIPRDALNKDGHRKGGAWTDFAAEHAGKMLMKHEEIADLLEMAEAVEQHPTAKGLIGGRGDSEVPLRMRCPITGLLLRCKLDRYLPGQFIADLKTSRDPHPDRFAASVAEFGYDRQRAFYSRLAAADCGAMDLDFWFVCIGKAKPYRVEVYNLDAAYMERGEQQLDRWTREIASAFANNHWQFDHYGRAVTIEMPRWVANKDQREIQKSFDDETEGNQ